MALSLQATLSPAGAVQFFTMPYMVLRLDAKLTRLPVRPDRYQQLHVKVVHAQHRNWSALHQKATKLQRPTTLKSVHLGSWLLRKHCIARFSLITEFKQVCFSCVCCEPCSHESLAFTQKGDHLMEEGPIGPSEVLRVSCAACTNSAKCC